MNVSSSNDETKCLLGKANKTKRWNQRSLISLILFSVCLFGIIVMGISIWNKDLPISNNTVKTRSPLHVSSTSTTNDDYVKHCAPKLKCDPNIKYRNFNGFCNNLKEPSWGASETPFFRMMNANYSDGYYYVRLQTNGKALPNARELNLKLFLSREIYRVDENNMLLLTFGQLLAHDISGQLIRPPINEHDEIFDCCHDENKRNAHPECQLVVKIPTDDPVYGNLNITCMGILRGMTSRNFNCPLYPTTFINANTHFIDASELYGSNEKVAMHLRVKEGGKLNFTIGDHGQMFCPFMATQKNPQELKYNNFLYDTGDKFNGNQNLGLTSMIILFLRYHNYIAFTLSSINPHWSDEIVYQESRRIVVATIQRIAYEDYLPIVIGDDFHEAYGLNEENIYDPSVNPSMSQEMSSAAFRLHNIIPVQFNFMNNNYKIEHSVNVTDWMTKPDLLPVDNNYHELLKGFLETPGRIPQPSYNFYISNFMFNIPSKLPYVGVDLMTADIVRGRDVGLPPYNLVRNLCGYPLAKDFEDLTDLMHLKDVRKLQELYYSVNDVDLMVGLLLEKLSNGAVVGPTARCLIADGFYRFKAGDRFFYDVQGQPSSFTTDQLKVIKKITLGHVLCITTNINYVHADIFKAVDHNLFSTSKLKCDESFSLDFNEWEENNDKSEL